MLCLCILCAYLKILSLFYFFMLKGIGGFMVRQRSRPGQGPGKAKRTLCRKDSSGSVSENPIGKDDGQDTLHLFFPHCNNLHNLKEIT